MPASYDKQIIQTVEQSDRPLRHSEIAHRIAPGNNRAWGVIGTSLTQLYRSGLLSRKKTDGKYWHYRLGDGTPPLIDRLDNLITAARAVAEQGAVDHDSFICPAEVGEALRVAVEALDKERL